VHDDSDFRFTSTDVRRMLRMLGEVAMLRGDLEAKRKRLIEGTAELLGADGVWWGLVCRDEAGGYALLAEYGGGRSSEAGRLAGRASVAALPGGESSIDNAAGEPPTPPASDAATALAVMESKIGGLMRRSEAGGALVEVSDRMIGLTQAAPDREGVSVVMVLSRAEGAAAFGRREAEMASALVDESALLHRVTLDSSERATPGLTGRRREVYEELMRGGTMRAIAERMGLSVHTVDWHVKAIYRVLGVSGRAELMSRGIAGYVEVVP